MQTNIITVCPTLLQLKDLQSDSLLLSKREDSYVEVSLAAAFSILCTAIVGLTLYVLY